MTNINTTAESSRALAQFHIVLFQPEIPPNTGNAIRLCANTGFQLHLIEPLGFAMEDKKLKRAGLDYHEWAAVKLHADFEAFMQAVNPKRVFALSTKSQRRYDQVQFADGDAFLFGQETKGLPPELLNSLPPEQRLRLPMRPGQRSLNLSNTVAVLAFEAWRQQDFAGGQ